MVKDSKDLLDILYKHDRGLQLYSFLDSSGRLIDSLTVAQLIVEIELFSRKLTRYPTGSRVLLVFPTSKNFLIAFFSCIYSGLIPVPVSVPGRRNGMDHVESIARDCSASLLIFDFDSYARLEQEVKDSLLAEIPFLSMFNVGEGHDVESTHASGSRVLARRHSDLNIAFLQYTSGSTSQPKGVIVTHQNIMANQEMIRERFETDESTVFLGWTPLHHDMGLIGNVMQPMYVGCRCFLLPPTTLLMRPKVWLQVLSNYKITVTGGPNFSYKHIINRVPESTLSKLTLDLRNIKVLYNGSEPIEIEVMQQFNEQFKGFGLDGTAFLTCYGLAEATLLVSGIYAHERYSCKPLCIDQISSQTKNTDIFARNAVASCGKAVKGVSIRIKSQSSGEILSANHIGIVEVLGESVSPGYWNRSVNPVRWLDTGDLGFMDEADELYICGRIKDVIILDGRNIYPQDLELSAEYSQTDLVASEFGAFGIGDDIYLVAELSRSSLKNVSEKNIALFKSSIKREISMHHGVGITNVIAVKPNSIPKTTSFKIQRQKLKHLYVSKQLIEVTHCE